MSNEKEDAGQTLPLVGSNLIIPVAAIALAIYYFTTIIDSPWTAKVTALFVGIILILLSGFFIIRSLISVWSGNAQFTFADLIEPVRMLPQRLILFALTLASIIVMPWIGFTLTSMLFLIAGILMLNNGRNVPRVIAMSVVLSILWFVLFVLVFQRHFPLGWLDLQIKAVVAPALKSIGLE